MIDPIVTVKNGKLRGRIFKNYDDGEYYSFQGIPYAKPPIGLLRFKPPVQAESWEGIKDATENGNDCIAYNPYLKATSGSEDCLFLNVYTKQLPNKNEQSKPVMFWIHGGGFVMGSGSSLMYGPDFLLTKDIVLVTINYRVGLLGFLNFEDTSLKVPGNMGLKDQVLALKWVHENISQFNGDPNNITVFGVSSGAASAHCLLLSPLAKGLFHKCIIQSGCILSWWAKGHRSLPYLTEALGIKTESEEDILKILQNMPAEEIIEMQQKVSENFQPSFKRCFGPVVEYKATGAFLTEEPDIIIKSGNYNHVPIIIGFTSREGMLSEVFFKQTKEYGYTIQNFENKIPYTIDVTKRTEHAKIMANKIRNFYYGELEPSKSNQNQYYLLQGDAGFVWPIFTTIKQHKSTSKTPIYLYKMSIDSNLNLVKNQLKIDNPGVSHGDDVGYLFRSILTPRIIPNSLEEKIMKTCVLLWTNFAAYGNPNVPTKGSAINVEWKPVEEDNFHYLDIGENLTTGINPEDNRIKFWNELGQCKTKL